jgi:hypothetical protein
MRLTFDDGTWWDVTPGNVVVAVSGSLLYDDLGALLRHQAREGEQIELRRIGREGDERTTKRVAKIAQ